MDTSRRDFLASAGAAAALATPLASLAEAPAWPKGPVRFVVPFPAGGGVDAAIRPVAAALGALWGQAAIVDNRPGGNTIIAVQNVLSAPRDGLSFLTTISLSLYLPHLMNKVPFNVADLVPVCPVALDLLVLVVNHTVPVSNMDELLRHSKANSGKVTMASYGPGSWPQLVALAMAEAGGGDMLVVPYRGATPQVQSIVAGETQVTVSNYGTLRPFIEQGKLRPIAVAGSKRSPLLPQVPTLGEVGIKGLDVPAWIGIFAAKGESSAVLDKMAADMARVTQSPELVTRFASFGQQPPQMTRSQFAAMLEADVASISRIIKAHNIRLD